MTKANRMFLMPLVLAMLMTLAACDGGKADLRHERQSGEYQNAMKAYAAGHMKQAAAGFEKVCRKDPGNASARFQLACILQDHVKDYLGALCAFREYVAQQPKSDKAALARERLAICEKELAVELTRKYGLSNNDAFAREAEAARGEQRAQTARADKLAEDLAQAMRRIAALNRENDRLKVALKDDPDGAAENVRPTIAVTEKSILDEDEEGAETDRIKLSEDVARLKIEEKAESTLGTAMLPPQPADAKARRDAAEAAAAAAAQRAESRPKEPPHEPRPAYYVVQEGDSLQRLAMRFYGRKSAWRLIRDANKAVISTDGRVNAGDRIRLP